MHGVIGSREMLDSARQGRVQFPSRGRAAATISVIVNMWQKL